MKKAKQIIADAIKNEIGEDVFNVEYDRSKKSPLMLVWADEWYLCGHAYTQSGRRVCFFSSARIRQILKGCHARWSKIDQAIQIHIS